MKSQNQILGFINQLCQRFGANCCTRGLLQMPRYLYMLKLYRAGFSDVFLISLNKKILSHTINHKFSVENLVTTML
jgi:hypothetical protein